MANPLDVLREDCCEHCLSGSPAWDAALAQVEALVKAIIAVENETRQAWAGQAFTLSDKQWSLQDALAPFKEKRS